MSDSSVYYAIDEPREKTIKIRRSIFTCRLQAVDSAEQAKKFISSVSKANMTATHNCWAYVVGDNGEVYHCSDAGEPAGTAGKPMLNTLQSCRMTQVAAVVTRIYGGVKLGVRGLIEAYSESVQAAVDMAPLKKRVKLVCFDVALSYGFNDTFLARFTPFLHGIVDTVYSEKIVHRVEVEERNAADAKELLSAYAAQGELIYTPVGSKR